MCIKHSLVDIDHDVILKKLNSQPSPKRIILILSINGVKVWIVHGIIKNKNWKMKSQFLLNHLIWTKRYKDKHAWHANLSSITPTIQKTYLCLICTLKFVLMQGDSLTNKLKKIKPEKASLLTHNQLTAKINFSSWSQCLKCMHHNYKLITRRSNWTSSKNTLI